MNVLTLFVFNWGRLLRIWSRLRGTNPILPFLALVVGFACLAVEVIESNEIMVDEFAHLPAGISYLDLHRFYLYRVNPPLIQGLAAFPVWLSGPNVDYSRAGQGFRSEWNVGFDFLRANIHLNRRYFSRARSVVTILAIACGVLIYYWSSKYHGRDIALVGASLWFLDPNILAHSTIVTTDIGAATFGIGATYAFWHFLRDPIWSKATLAGVVLGLAQGSKLSLLALYPSWLILAILTRCPSMIGPAPGQISRRSPWLQLGGIFAISLFVLNTLYLFDGMGKPLGSFKFQSQLLSGFPTTLNKPLVSANRFAGTMLSGLPIPLPRDYVLGIDTQEWERDRGGVNLLDGRLSRGGQWSSPLVTFSQKLPVGSLLLLNVCTCIALLHLRKANFIDLVVWVPALVMLVLLCLEKSMNWAIRYSVIIFPFMCIAIGRVLQAAWRHRLARYFIVTCLAANVGELLASRPYYLSFGNCLIGGTDGSQRLFLGSNFDWGQDLLRLRAWAKEHQEYGAIAISYYGVVDPTSVGLNNRPLPSKFYKVESGTASEPSTEFYWAISSNVLNGLPILITLDDESQVLGSVPCLPLRPEKAFAKVGSTIYVFRINSSINKFQVNHSGIDPAELHGCIVDVTQLSARVLNNRGLTNFLSP